MHRQQKTWPHGVEAGARLDERQSAHLASTSGDAVDDDGRSVSPTTRPKTSRSIGASAARVPSAS
jgi:hypothetical protein